MKVTAEKTEGKSLQALKREMGTTPMTSREVHDSDLKTYDTSCHDGKNVIVLDDKDRPTDDLLQELKSLRASQLKQDLNIDEQVAQAVQRLMAEKEAEQSSLDDKIAKAVAEERKKWEAEVKSKSK